VKLTVNDHCLVDSLVDGKLMLAFVKGFGVPVFRLWELAEFPL